MSMSARQHPLSLHIQHVQHDFKVLEFTGDEAISTPYGFTVELVSEQACIDLDTLLGHSAFLAFDSQGSGVHGQISSIEKNSPGSRLTLTPHLANLVHRTNHRIFQNLTVQQIIEQLLEEHGIFSDAYAFNAFSPCLPREYCVQYAESDLDFIQRLCFEEGFHYYFTHSPDGHTLVFGDKQQAFTPLNPPTPYLPDNGMVAAEPSIDHFQLTLKVGTHHVVRRDYDFQKASLTLEADSYSEHKERVLEDYSYPGGFKEKADGGPQKVYAKPRILGSQTARVTGPVGEEIHCDESGRVRVKFHWDRSDLNNEQSSCWVRVSSSWAGDGRVRRSVR